MANIVIEITKGTSRDFTFQAQSLDGTAPTTFLATDVLTAAVFAGDGQPVLVAPAVSWVNAATATYEVVFQNSDTATLDSATYLMTVTLTRGGRAVVIGRMSLSVLPSTGAGTAPAVYCQFSDLLPYFPNVTKLQDELRDFSGFAAQRNMARTWFEDRIQRHYRLNVGTGLTTFGNAVVSWGPRRLGSNNKILQGYLDQNLLMTAAPRRVIEINAKYTLGLICQAQITGTDARSNYYQQRAAEFFQDAEDICMGTSAEVDINGDGYPEYVIHLGTTDALYG